MIMLRNFIRLIITISAFIFSIACGLFLVRFLPPLYFLLFSAISQTLISFYIVMGIFLLSCVALIYVLFKKGKYNWGIWIFGTLVLLLGFGAPLFMLENNEMLWQEAVQDRKGPVYFIEFTDGQINLMQSVIKMFWFVWNEVYLFVYGYLAVYLAGYLYLRRQGWRIRGIRL